jgi:hypothetical protein
VTPRDLDQIEVAFQIVIPGHEVSRFATDGGLQDLVIVGITARPEITRYCDDVRPGRDESNESFGLMAGICKLSGQSWTAKDLGNLDELWEGGDNVKLAAQPACNDLARRACWLQEGRYPNVRVKQGDERHGVSP